MNWESGVDTYALLCIRQITNENLLDTTGNSALSSVVTSVRRESKNKGLSVNI